MRLTDYLCDNDLNESLQSAYKKHHICETALLRVQNDIMKSIDNKQCVVRSWTYQQPSTPSIIKSRYTDCDPDLL